MDFSTAVDRISHRGLLYKLRSIIGVGGQFLFIVSVFLSDRRQRVRLNGKVSESVAVVSGVPQGSILRAILFILYTSELFHIVGNHIVGYEDDTTIYTVIHGPLLRSQVMESLNQDLSVINSWCLKWHMRLNIKKTKFMVVSQSRTIAPGYGELTVGSTELEEVKSLRILGVTLNSNLTFEMHVRGVVSKAARSLGVVRRAESLFDCPRVLKSCFTAYVLFSLEYCASV